MKSKLNIVSFYLFAYYNRHYNEIHTNDLFCGPVFTFYGEKFISFWFFFLSFCVKQRQKKVKGDEIDLKCSSRERTLISWFTFLFSHFDSIAFDFVVFIQIANFLFCFDFCSPFFGYDSMRGNVKCVDGYPYLNTCPSGLHFDDVAKYCTFKNEARCGPLATSKFTHKLKIPCAHWFDWF